MRERRLSTLVLVALLCALVVPPAAAAPLAVTDHQAEDASIHQGVVESNHSGYTGAGFVNYENVTGSYVQWSVTVAQAGSAKLTFRFANGTTANRPMDITVNDTIVADDLTFAATGAWATWQTTSVTVNLRAGANTVRATATTSAGGPNVDRLTVDSGGVTPVGTPTEINGQLSVCGVKLCNQHGNPIQLRGMSTHGLQWYRDCVTDGSLSALATDWNADIVRISMYIQEGGYETNPRLYTDLVHSIIDKVTARGMYALVDWHMLSPGDPYHNLARAKTFFAEIAQRHNGKNNLLYEIANEPNGVSWSRVRSYAEELIPVIRANDPETPILVGTRAWSSLGVSDGGNETEVVNNPVRANNIMYTFHFYAASHGDEYLNALSRAADRIPMFVTEFGTQTYTGDGGNDFAMSQRYLDLMAAKKISWTNWNFSDDFRSGAVFNEGVCPNGPYTGTAPLKSAGVWIRARINTPDDFPTHAAAGTASATVNVRDHGAVGSGKVNDTPAIQRAIDAAAAAGGGTVLFPPGTYQSRNTIHLRSNITMRLEAGATVKGSSHDQYDEPEDNPWDDYQDYGHSHFHNAMIYGDRLTNIAFVGAGVIDGGGHLITGNPDEGEADKIISLTRCDGLTVGDGLTLRRGGHFAMLINGCTDVRSDRLRIDTAGDRDGWNVISTTNVTITNADIAANDDALAFKSDYALGATLPNGNVTVTDTRLSAVCCNALMFGSETCGDFTGYDFERITINGSNKSGLGMVSMDGTVISDVHYRDITMTNVRAAITQKVGTRRRCGDNPGVGRIHDITYENITSSGQDSANFTATLWGESGATNKISDVTFTNVDLTVPGGSGSVSTGVPSNDPHNYNPNSIGTRPAYGWYLRNVEDVRFVDSSVRFDDRDARPAVIANNSRSVVLDPFVAERGTASTDVLFQNVTGYCVRNATNTTGGALRVGQTGSTESCPAFPARVITVSSIAQLQAAADAAQPGDRIELVDGVYTTSGSIPLRRSGTASAPITIAAQNIGGAEIRGSAGFSFADSDHVVVEGFRLRHGGSVSVPAGSHHVRLTRNVVQLSGSGNWVTVTGNDVEVDHNTFQNKSTTGVFLQISGPGDAGMAQRTRVHHNHFRDHTFTGDNGGESIRLGYSFRQLASAGAVVEDNLFERANGDSEAISVKSSDNVIRYNTIRDSRGSIVLRHGNRNLVEGNLMLGNTAGLRFYDNDHVLINNVIQGGTGQIIAGSGTVADDTTGSTAHARPDRVLVAFNTVVGNRTNLVQVGQGTDRLGPNECTFANNIVVGGGSGALLDIDEGTGLRWQGNVVWAGTGGNAPSSGYRTVNPALVTDAGGLRRLSAGSPAIDAAAGSYSQAARDVDLQTRSGTKDVGADEYATGTQRRPLTAADVGPNA